MLVYVVLIVQALYNHKSAKGFYGNQTFTALCWDTISFNQLFSNLYDVPTSEKKQPQSGETKDDRNKLQY